MAATRFACVVLCAALLFGGAARVEAQSSEPARTFGELQPRLKVNQPLIVTNEKGAFEGRLVAVSSDQLEIKQGGTWGERERRLTFAAVEVRRVVHNDSNWEGMVIGGAIGVALGVWEVNTPSDDEGSFGASLALFPILGGYVGKWIDERHHRTLYVSPGAVTTAVRPLIGKGRAGIAAVIQF